MSEEIDKHVLRKYEIQQKLGKGVSNARVACLSPVSRIADVEIVLTSSSLRAGVRHRLESRR